MSEAMLTLFKGQLEAECEKIRTEHDLQKRGDWLIWWYFTRILSFSSDDVSEVHCDGGGDLGIDAIWIDDEELVHFFNFKNPQKMESVTEAGEIDKTISGLQVIIQRKHGKIANPELRDRVAEIYSIVPKGYVIHTVTSGAGIPEESSVKLKSLVETLGSKMFSWSEENLSQLHDRFYTRSLKSVDTPIIFQLQGAPHAVRSGAGDIHFFSASGEFLADIYETHGEGLLERNIRVDQGYTPTNKSIEISCSGDSSANFIHYNNGVTFICRSAVYDPFTSRMNLMGSQIVNGGQTIRSLHRCFRSGKLRKDVVVPVRAITGSDDKYFANDVAVSQNNQNPMGLGFLRSTDARVVQLSHTLASIGCIWRHVQERLLRFPQTTVREPRSELEMR